MDVKICLIRLMYCGWWVGLCLCFCLCWICLLWVMKGVVCWW